MPSVQSYPFWVERFKEYLEVRKYSRRTVPDYCTYVRRFFAYLEERGIRSLGEVSREVVQAYQTHLFTVKRKGKPLSVESQQHHLVALKAFFRFLVTHDYLLADPAADLELPRRKKGLPRGIMTQKEVVRILEQPDLATPLGLRDRAILELLYSSGIRNEELRTLSALDVDVGAGSVLIREGKNAKSRLVPLGEVAGSWVSRYLEASRPLLALDPEEKRLFVSKNGRPMTSSNLIVMVKKYVRKAQVKKAVTPHAFRHTCATHLLKGKADLRYIQELLGHASVATTQIYTKVEVSDLRRVHQRCHPRERKALAKGGADA